MTSRAKGATRQASSRQFQYRRLGSRPASTARRAMNQPMQHAAISRPSGRVSSASARLKDAASSPRRLFRYRDRQTTAATTKQVNCRVSSPPAEVHTPKVALLQTRPSAIHAVRPRWRSPDSRAAHQSSAAMVAAV